MKKILSFIIKSFLLIGFLTRANVGFANQQNYYPDRFSVRVNTVKLYRGRYGDFDEILIEGMETKRNRTVSISFVCFDLVNEAKMFENVIGEVFAYEGRYIEPADAYFGGTLSKEGGVYGGDPFFFTTLRREDCRS